MLRNGILSLILLAGLLPARMPEVKPVPSDSIGQKVVNGRVYVLHQVSGGETLFKLSQLYKVAVDSIRSVNKLSDIGIYMGQVLMIPTKRTATEPVKQQPKPEPVKDPVTQPGMLKHTVSAGESLFSISKKYNVPVDKIKGVNKLTSDELKVGQVLQIPVPAPPPVKDPVKDPVKEPVKDPVKEQVKEPVKEPLKGTTHEVKPGETLFGIAVKYSLTVQEIREINNLTSDALKIGQVLKVQKPDPVVVNTVPVKNEPDTKDPVKQPDQIAPKPSPDKDPNQKDPQQEYSSTFSITVVPPKDTVKKEPVKQELQLEEDPGDINIPEEKKPQPFTIPAGAKTHVYKDPIQNKEYLQVEETGPLGSVPSYAGDKLKFYASHRTLPVGTHVRVENPQLKIAVYVEIMNNTDVGPNDVIAISPKALDYLLLKKGDAVVIRYAVPKP